MPYNLIHEPWVPVRPGAGPAQYVPPWRVCQTDPAPWAGLAAARADLGAATAQMLIGLLQVACAPPDGDAWLEWYRQPPTPEALRARLESLAPAFAVDGDHPFMQDRDCPKEKKNSFPLAVLLPDQPAKNTRDNNADHFVKRDVVVGMCAACLAPALYWRQACMGGFGGGPGGGFRDGLRLKAPLTVLVQGPDLWRTLWLNVLPVPEFLGLVPPGPGDAWEHRFPWMGLVRRSDKGQTILPGEIHPDQLYWPLAQSIRVDFSDAESDTICPLCGQPNKRLFRSFWRRPGGPLYAKAGWRHPLTPTWLDEENLPVFMQTPAGGVGFGDWLGVAIQGQVGKHTRYPAPVVRAFYSRLLDLEADAPPEGYRAWACGLEMDQAKSLRFSDAHMPLLPLPEEARLVFADQVAKLVAVAEQAASRLRGYLKEALFGPNAKPKYDGGVLGLALERFWAACERPFYQTLGPLLAAVQAHLADDPEGQRLAEVKEAWLQELCRQGRAIFDTLSDADQQHLVDPGRWARASQGLRRGLGPGTKKLREILELPARQTPRKEVSA